MILSVSRRTDIPAFYSDWFINRVRDGYVYVRNPFNANQISNIPLNSELVDCTVFWSKNPEPIVKYLPEICERLGDAFYFQYTINPYGNEVEPAVPSLQRRIDVFKEIAEEYGEIRTVWRYDPVFLSDKYSLEWHVSAFERLFNQLANYTDTCVISFIDMYDKTQCNTKDIGIRALSLEEMNYIAEAFSKIVADSGVQLKTCAEGIELEKYGIKHNSCIDQERIEKILGCKLKAKPDKQRDNCQCIECADIGIYNTCKHGCKYCYANFNLSKVRAAVEGHDISSPLLTGQLTKECVVTNYSKAKSLKIGKTGQISFFESMCN